MKCFVICVFSVLVLFMNGIAANVTVDGQQFDGAKLIGSVTYVPIRGFSENVSDCEVMWENEERVATVVLENSKAQAKIGKAYLECAGRYVYSGNENKIIDGSTYVPIRSIAKILGADIIWDSVSKTAVVDTQGEKFLSESEFYNRDDLYWLSKIISAESSGETLKGKIAVGNVVLNRVESEDYPNNIYDVIFDTKNGVQFTPVLNGTINNEPTEESIMAAKICLENYRLSEHNILFFLNPEISTSTWVPDNRDFVMSIGRHDFYA